MQRPAAFASGTAMCERMRTGVWPWVCRLAARCRAVGLRKGEAALDPDRVPPLAQLMNDVEPPADLLLQIEAKLDVDTELDVAKLSTRPISLRLHFAAAGLLAGLSLGAGGMYLLADRVPFHAVGLDGRSAGVLGHISVHGTPMHLGLQQFCRDADQLAISITPKKSHPRAGSGPQTDFTRKFLIHCNF